MGLNGWERKSGRGIWVFGDWRLERASREQLGSGHNTVESVVEEVAAVKAWKSALPCSVLLGAAQSSLARWFEELVPPSRPA